MFFILLGIYLLFSIPFNFLISICENQFNLNRIILDISSLSLIILSITYSPLSEEIAFRIMLKPSWKNTMIFTLLFWFLATMCLLRKEYILLCIFLTIGSASLVTLINKNIRSVFQAFILRHFRFFFYLSSILFGLIHIFNYEPVSIKLLILAPIIIAPNIIAGLILGYIRMKFGIIYSILLHIAINTLAIPSLLSN